MSGLRRLDGQGEEQTGTANRTADASPEVEPSGNAAPYLVVFGRDASRVEQLAGDGVYVLGRSAEADVPIDDQALSRRHASLMVARGRVLLEDLGSSNGSWLNGHRLVEPTALLAGDVIRLGDTQIVFQCRGTPPRPSAIAEPQPFLERLHAEVERSLRYLHPFTLLVIGTRRDEPRAAESVARALRGMDTAGWLDAHTLGVLMPELAAADAVLVSQRVLQSAREVSPAVRCGLASWPDDGCDGPTLLQAARGALDGAVAGTVRSVQETFSTIELGRHQVTFADPAMLRTFELARRLASSTLPVLILGETGVGKEIFATALHHLSPRERGPLVTVNCAGLPETLAESELFGHARGAFTGADRARIGRVEAANRGTLFLDEVGELSPLVQAKLLRVLEEHLVTRLGENESYPVDVRIVAATNRDLGAEVAAGRFRQDLFFRLAAATLTVPPLRERPLEIPVLARLFLRQIAERTGQPTLVIAAETMRALVGYPWPGNVRELRNEIERAAATADGPTLWRGALLEAIGGTTPFAATAAVPGELPRLEDEVRALEVRLMRQALAACEGNQTRAADRLGVPLRTFQTKVKLYGLEGGRRGRPRGGQGQ